MKTNCGCGVPVEIHSDVAVKEPQCEACETVECTCGSTDFKEQTGLYCHKVVCKNCDRLIEAIFTY